MTISARLIPEFLSPQQEAVPLLDQHNVLLEKISRAEIIRLAAAGKVEGRLAGSRLRYVQLCGRGAALAKPKFKIPEFEAPGDPSVFLWAGAPSDGTVRVMQAHRRFPSALLNELD